MRSITYQTGLVSFIVEGARSESTRSLYLLRAIEDTVARNEVLATTFESIAKNAGEIAHSICNREGNARRYLDNEDGVVQQAFDGALDTIFELVSALEAKRAAAAADGQLQRGDGVVESFDRAIGQVMDAFNHLHDLKWAVMENDADVAAVVDGGPYFNVEDFIESLGK
ncbi:MULTISPECIES: hypothetical protein [Achromobacter]|uniref:hypothetical protein n=1 Tax=Achromobacter TaxID=222 RepID=UPI001EEF1260|nr:MULTISPECIES: hypothetical protein [Achromobacter]